MFSVAFFLGGRHYAKKQAEVEKETIVKPYVRELEHEIDYLRCRIQKRSIPGWSLDNLALPSDKDKFSRNGCPRPIFESE